MKQYLKYYSKFFAVLIFGYIIFIFIFNIFYESNEEKITKLKGVIAYKETKLNQIKNDLNHSLNTYLADFNYYRIEYKHLFENDKERDEFIKDMLDSSIDFDRVLIKSLESDIFQLKKNINSINNQ